MHLHGRDGRFIEDVVSRWLISGRKSYWSIAERTFGVVLLVKKKILS